ncbi:selenium metabolism-associated LysR family transcriptional regulator [Desulfurivibrio dismutans]|uniref:selenium metabolism-associated LysR family transcriptional regulator n=1 Tax=Desulfurivibrio dismutans TaxID=1398908 RepID=UPI0023DAB64C|nr:selenium metabolism-associated LysR family transcriptional regulator [Desulfurivibrio alkaliphilus]MDF1615333.1 selenium metabolism-associated LysR family transcriptional regulator [Desulfurivibrio alkaliphilus]
MDLHRLEVFCRVVELKSFTKAAEAAFLSQPTVSEHLRSLEETLGVRLVDRLGREVLPTPAGKLLYDHARRLLRLHDEAVAAIENYSGRQSGHLWMAASTIPGTYLLPKMIGQFKKEYPEVLVTIKIANSRQAAELVIRGDCEFGVVGARWREAVLEWEPLLADELTLVVRHDHPWSRRGEIEPAELAEVPFIDRERESGTRKVMHEILHRHGTEANKLRIIAEMGSTEAVLQSVKAGIGVAIISRQAIRDDLACGAVAEVTIKGINFRRPFYLVQRKKRHPSPIGTLFLDFLKDTANRNS